MAATAPSPALFFETLRMYERTAALQTALELDVFTALADGAGTPRELAARCQVAERGARILCDALAVYGFVTKSGERYALTADSAAFLSRRSPAYLGDVHRFLAGPYSRRAFAELTASVRKGGTAVPDDGSLAPDSAVWVDFARYMAPMMALPAQFIAQRLAELGGAHKVLDIAAGHGMFGIVCAQRHPDARIYALDAAPVLAVARENAARAGVESRYHTLPGSAFELDLGSGYDWVLLPNFLHHFDVPTNVGLLRRVRAALAPGGRVATLEFVPEADRISPPQAATFSLIMLANTPAGDAYTAAELESMFREAGFARSEFTPVPPGFQTLAISTP